MHMVSSLVMASMLTFSLSAMGKPPLLQVRGDIVRAISAGDINRLTAVLDQNGLTVNTVISEDGWPLLYYAVLLSTPDLVKYMLEESAVLNHIDSRGNTPLDAAKILRPEMPEMAALLEQAGAVHGEDSSFMRIPADISRSAWDAVKEAFREN